MEIGKNVRAEKSVLNSRVVPQRRQSNLFWAIHVFALIPNRLAHLLSQIVVKEKFKVMSVACRASVAVEH
jgi:hypothetical protein